MAELALTPEAGIMVDNLGPFRVLGSKSLRFVRDKKEYRLVGGRYPGGAGALQIDGPEGPECKLTVNLIAAEPPSNQLPIGEFWSPTADKTFRHRLRQLGVLEPGSLRTGQAYVRDYAETWRFARCPVFDSHKVALGTFVVECAECRAQIDAQYVEEMRRIDARWVADELMPRRPRRGQR